MLTDLKTDPKVVEQLVEIITHEVLVAMLEQKEKEKAPEGGQCKFNCTDGLCVRTCFDQAGHVISAGADRLSSTLGVIPGDIDLAKTIDHTLLKPDATQDQIAHSEMATEIFLSTISQWHIEPENHAFGWCVIATQVSLVQMSAIGKAKIFVTDFQTTNDLTGI